MTNRHHLPRFILTVLAVLLVLPVWLTGTPTAGAVTTSDCAPHGGLTPGFAIRTTMKTYRPNDKHRPSLRSATTVPLGGILEALQPYPASPPSVEAPLQSSEKGALSREWWRWLTRYEAVISVRVIRCDGRAIPLISHGNGAGSDVAPLTYETEMDNGYVLDRWEGTLALSRVPSLAKPAQMWGSHRRLYGRVVLASQYPFRGVVRLRLDFQTGDGTLARHQSKVVRLSVR